MQSKTMLNETTKKINYSVNEVVHNPELSLGEKLRFVRNLQHNLNLHIDNMTVHHVGETITAGVQSLTAMILKEKTSTNQKLKGN